MSCPSRNLCAVTVLTLLAAVLGPASAETLDVYPDGKTGFASIQAAVNAARDGDVVVLAVGTYTGPGNRDVDLSGKALTIQSTDPGNPDVVAGTVIDCQGSDKTPHRGFLAADVDGAIIAGLTITNGLAETGGAVYCVNSALTLADCRIIGNATLPGGAGGGLSAVASALIVEGCEISGNAAGGGADSLNGRAQDGGDGGGVYATGSVVYVSDSTIGDNTAGAGGNSNAAPGRGGHGGGINADSLLVVRSDILANTAGRGGNGTQGADGGQGGGVYCTRGTIQNSIIEGNAAGDGGDSTYGEKGIAGQGGDGGGILCADSLQMTSTLVAGNRSGRLGLGVSAAGMTAAGGGIRCADAAIDACTIVSNATDAGPLAGGGLFTFGQVSLTNSIAWGNTPDQLFGVNYDSVAYCDIVPALRNPAEQGNISADPAFVQPGYWANPQDPATSVPATDPGAVWIAGDYRLTAESPCRDAGDPNYKSDPNATDLAGAKRVAGKAIDIGAYELRTLLPVYRFWSSRSGKHFFTIDEAEKDQLLTQTETWIYEGVAYQAYAAATEPGLMAVYRFWSNKLSSHFWTISEAERDRLIAGLAGDWTYEGPVFYAYPEGSQPGDAAPVYRFWSDSSRAHFYTIDEAEKDALMKDQADVWTFEGIVWYAYEPDPSDQEPPTPQPQGSEYEFTSKGTAASCGFELKAYFDGREVQIGNSSVVLFPTTGVMTMVVDFDDLTTSLTDFAVGSDLTQHVAVISDSETVGAVFPLALTVQGTFATTTARGPFAIDPQTHAFSTPTTGQGPIGDEVFQVTGSAVLEGQKYEVNLALTPTDFEVDGRATFNDTAYPDRLDVTMDGPFQWRRQGQEDLLLEADLKGHLLQVFVTSAHVRPTGLWLGKDLAAEAKPEK